MSSPSLEFRQPLPPFRWYRSGCQTGTCGNMFPKTLTSADCNWCVSMREGARLEVDDYLVVRYRPWVVVFTLPRCHARRFEGGMSHLFLFAAPRTYRVRFQDNILVDKSGCARLNDFGFTTIASLNCTETSTPGFQGSYRWMAPELFNVEQNPEKSGTPTRQSDVFALGMVAIEVNTFLPSSDVLIVYNLWHLGVHGTSAVP